MRGKTCCFSGHRRLPPERREAIAAATEAAVRTLIAEGFCYFGVGGAVGFYTLAAETVLRLREDFPQIRLIAVLPCADQAVYWSAEDRFVWERIRERADKVVCLRERYTPDCMKERDRHLVDHSDVCVCYLTQYGGGTGYTVSYAVRRGLRVVNVAEEPCF